MACVVKARPCRLNFSSLSSLECPRSNLSHGSATPGGRSRSRNCEKRASPEPCQRYDDASPKFVSPAADVFLAMQKQKQQQHHQYQERIQRQNGVCPKRMRRNRRSRESLSVRFSCCSKNHDGLRFPSRILDSLVFQYFETHRITCPDDIQTLIRHQFGGNSDCFSENILVEVLQQLKELCDRCGRLGDNGSMPVLIQGGGRGSQLQAVHRPHLCRLTHFFELFKEKFLDESVLDR